MCPFLYFKNKYFLLFTLGWNMYLLFKGLSWCLHQWSVQSSNLWKSAYGVFYTRKQWNEKADANVIQGGYSPSWAACWTWQCCPHGASCRYIKDASERSSFFLHKFRESFGYFLVNSPSQASEAPVPMFCVSRLRSQTPKATHHGQHVIWLVSTVSWSALSKLYMA